MFKVVVTKKAEQPFIPGSVTNVYGVHVIDEWVGHERNVFQQTTQFLVANTKGEFVWKPMEWFVAPRG